jgi:hypothetical protein
MPQELSNLTVNEISLVDRGANASIDPVTGKKIEHARIALFKRDDSDDAGAKVIDDEVRTLCKADDPWDSKDELCKALVGGGTDGVCKDGACQTQGGQCYPKGDWAYTPDDTPSHWKLRLTDSPGGKPSAKIVGAAVAALGKGFRGRKVQLPSAALASVKAKVRAAWKAANPDKGADEMPPVLKSEKGESTVTLEQIEKKVTEQDGVIATLKADNDVLKAENEVVLKMSKTERKAYSSMSADKRKEFMAGDAEKRKNMISAAVGKMDEDKLIEKMDADTRKKFDAAGPVTKAAMLEEAEKVDKKKKAAKPDTTDSTNDNDEDDDDAKTARKFFTGELNTVRDENVALKDRVTKSETELLAIRKRERLLVFTKRAEDELPNTSGKPIEKGEMLMQLADALPGGENGEPFKKQMELLKSADKAIGIHFGEVGKAGGTVPALAAFEAKVEEISKRDKLDKAHATEKAMFEAPELYIDYEHDLNNRIATRGARA